MVYPIRPEFQENSGEAGGTAGHIEIDFKENFGIAAVAIHHHYHP